MRLVVTGKDGQIARALAELAGETVTVICIGRPELDLARIDTIAPALSAMQPDVIVNAAAYTAVDKAESEPDIAFAINARGAGAVATAAARLGVPVVQISTDYVFDGRKASAYREDDRTGATGVYGASKLAGEGAVVVANPDHVILRTAWVYGPHGRNFVRTMLALGATRDVVRVVADQRGSPSYAPEVAGGILTVARNLRDRPGDSALRGVFHMAGSGEASWAELAEAVFASNAARGAAKVRVERIETADYPTAARRPLNSRLDGSKVAALHGVRLPDWRLSLEACLDRLVSASTDKRADSNWSIR